MRTWIGRRWADVRTTWSPIVFDMPLISVNELHIGFRGPALLDSVSCQIEPGERIGLLGRNGAGKSTFLRILNGDVEPDEGQVRYSLGASVALLSQDVPQDVTGRVMDIVVRGFKPTDAGDAWQVEQRATQLLSRMELPADAAFESLSSGMKRRVLLAQALAGDPDVLLLDEPTNHLDVESITWLEEFLARCRATLIFVTHDRRFLRNLATRILEIDRGRLFDWSCDYETFLVRKVDALAAEEKQNALFDKRLAEEEVWIRQGVKARRTRNEGRVRALEAMRKARSERQSPTSNARIEIQEGNRSGTLVAAASAIAFSYGEREVFRDFSTSVMRGDKIGVMGPNGAGKTTLLRVLLGQLSPKSGTVRLGTNLQIAYFDQLRQQLDDDRSVQDNVTDGSASIQFNGQSRHVIGYLQDFLFSPEQARGPVRFLSGGERNRVLLAKLFAKPANVLVLDEPTNDLDAETLELLEDRLVQFEGTVLMVSHDRTFLNNVVTSTIVFEDGGVREYVGGYDDWLRQRANRSVNEVSAMKAAVRSESPSAPAKPSRKLTFKERQERDTLPALIERIESQVAAIHADMASPDYYRQSGERIAAVADQLRQLESQLANAYERWEILEALGE